MPSPPETVNTSSNEQSSLKISSGSTSGAPMPAAPTVVNLVHIDIDESMNETSNVQPTVVEHITIHSSGSEMRISDISMIRPSLANDAIQMKTNCSLDLSTVRPLDETLVTHSLTMSPKDLVPIAMSIRRTTSRRRHCDPEVHGH